MKCPNCGKEALLANGKYICVDCGIEITPQEEAVQSANSEIDFNNDTANNAEPQSSSSVAPESNKAPEQPQAQPPVPPSPLQDNNSQNLNQNDQTSSSEMVDNESLPSNASAPVPEPPQPSGDSSDLESAKVKEGVYEFDSGNSQPDSNSQAPNLNESPSSESQNSLQTPQSDTSGQGYFNPSSFDLGGNSSQGAPSPESSADAQPLTPKATPEETFEAFSTPSGIGAGEPTIDNLSSQESPQSSESSPLSGAQDASMSDNNPISSDNQPEPENPNINEVISSDSSEQSSFSGEAPAKNLDQMLDEASAMPSAFGHPSASNVDSVRSSNGSNGEDIPPVSEVFGQNKVPTPQDFGVAPKPEPEDNKSNKKIYIIIAAVVIGILVLVGIIFGVVRFLNSRNQGPVVLGQEEISLLSSNVSAALDNALNIKSQYNFSVEFKDINVTAEEGAQLYEESLSSPYSIEGEWSSNSDGDIQSVYRFADSESDNKKVYVALDGKTYIYDNDKDEWQEKKDIQLNEIPAIFSPKTRSLVFYLSNIQSATLKEEGDDYKVYEFVPTSELAQSILSSSGAIMSSANFQSVDVGTLKISARVDLQNRVQRLEINGDVSFVADEFQGAATINAQADYSYDEVQIENPKISQVPEKTDQEEPIVEEEPAEEPAPKEEPTGETTESPSDEDLQKNSEEEVSNGRG